MATFSAQTSSIERGRGAALAPVPTTDPLAYLPWSTIREYGRGERIYDREEPATSLHLIIEGCVKVGRITGNAKEIVLDLYRADEFFGEAALLRSSQLPTEFAAAIKPTKVMSWSIREIEEIAEKRPPFAIALLQLLAQRGVEFAQRIERLAFETMARRLAWALLRFAERFGHESGDGSIHLFALSHELLAQYIGTSREIVTSRMNKFRRRGCLHYSRQGILILPQRLQEWLSTGQQD